MQEPGFQQRIRDYDVWKIELAARIERIQNWFDEQRLGTPHDALPVYEALQALRSDRITVAFMGEFSRGKSELINAIFFADQGRRLLPTDAGRTTMCPTELGYDPDDPEPCIRLLPIETRATPLSLAEYKRNPLHWNRLPLNVHSAEQMAATLREVARFKTVSLDEAKRLGLYSEDMPVLPDGRVEIPHWRHALINFPHPLLKQGLVILDTPGLNALGSEPELTLHMLPAAQAVLFVLAADTGVTRSDLAMWQQPFHGQRQRRCGLLVALNKIDTLWDELTDPASTEAAIAHQRQLCAGQLGVDEACVFPVSAQKALVARVRNDPGLLARSRLPELERYLCEEVIPAKLRIVHDTVLAAVDTRAMEVRDLLNGRLQQQDRQLDELRALRGQNSDAVLHLMAETRVEQTHYLKSVEHFQTTRNLVMRNGRILLDILSPATFDQSIAQTRQALTESWTTLGLKQGMQNFFEGARATLHEALAQAEQVQHLVNAGYRRFHDTHGLPALQPKTLALQRHYVALDELCQDAAEFRDSAATAMTEQTFVIRKFILTLVQQAREVFVYAHRDAETWLNEVLNPLQVQIREYRHGMEQRLETLRRISQSRDTLELKLKELERRCQILQEQLTTLQQLRVDLHQPLAEVPADNVTPLRAVG